MKKIAFILFLSFCSIHLYAKKPKVVGQQISLFGVGISLSDSVIYITPIQTIPEATIDSKTGFLDNRAFYSMQLKNFLEGQGVTNPICTTFFSTDKQKLNKKLGNVTKHYNRKFPQKLTYVHEGEFTYKVYTTSNSEEREDE
ncbi:MAG: hypothetical protein IJ816_01925 [Alloprevotella sp.]|nr:hypothetical protein [Alloprevotella sp.]